MKGFLRNLVVGLALAAAPGTASALDASPDKFEERLKAYDPATLAAARQYMQTFGMKDMLEKSVPQLRAGLITQLKAKNPQIDEKQTAMFMDAFFKSALVDDAPVLEQATILMMLDIFKKDELVALNQFYSTPVGKSILVKMPQMMGRIPELQSLLQTYVLPRALQHARDEMKKAGVEMKL